MNPADITGLQRVRLLAGLPPQDLAVIAGRGTRRRLRPNTVFIERDDTSSNLYLILSGRAKVYLRDLSGQERWLRTVGPGEHLGELALLRDAVRTASAITLEDCEMLVLSRRAFIACLSDWPQIALNLDASLAEPALMRDFGEAVTRRYRAWSRFRQSGLPIILLIGGCSGTGKSTLAAELALRLDIGRTLSTDILREVVRLFVSEQAAPALHTSSYAAWRGTDVRAPNQVDVTRRLVEGFRAQSEQLATTIGEVIKRSVKERASTVIEGIHVLPGDHIQVAQTDAVVVPILLTSPSKHDLEQHFLRRGQLAPSRTASRYLENLSAIWHIQNYLIAQAQRHGVTVVANAQLDVTLSKVIDVITGCLVARFG